jgi:hypothetical protein
VTKPRRHLPVVQSDETYERNYAVRKQIADEAANHLAAAIAECGAGADCYGRHIVHDKLGIDPDHEIYCRRDDGVWSPPEPACEERILRQFAVVTNHTGGIKYQTGAVTVLEGRFAEASVTHFPRRYSVMTAIMPLDGYKPRTPEQMKAAAEQRRATALAKVAAEDHAEAERRSWQLELPMGAP